ncbi:hypothetical protein [Streptomyces sp. NBC_01506]|uniref:hypothetical protein n=1 Tax=Streptomyces sp. NBC_01506 TaxID=2903887 RepID=UPI003865A754
MRDLKDNLGPKLIGEFNAAIDFAIEAAIDYETGRDVTLWSIPQIYATEEILGVPLEIEQ